MIPVSVICMHAWYDSNKRRGYKLLEAYEYFMGQLVLYFRNSMKTIK